MNELTRPKSTPVPTDVSMLEAVYDWAHARAREDGNTGPWYLAVQPEVYKELKPLANRVEVQIVVPPREVLTFYTPEGCVYVWDESPLSTVNGIPSPHGA